MEAADSASSRAKQFAAGTDAAVHVAEFLSDRDSNKPEAVNFFRDICKD